MAIQRCAEVSMTTDTARGDGLDRLKSTRGSNRGVVTKLIKESESRLNEEKKGREDPQIDFGTIDVWNSTPCPLF